MRRKIYNDLLMWKNKESNRKPLMVLGVRQCGKTHIINEFCENEFKHYKKINLFNDTAIIDLYKSDLSSLEKYTRLKVLIDFDFDVEDSILFIDEIQECEELISDLKYFCEEHNNVRIICSGSLLGVKLNRLVKSFPVGKVDRFYMYPMDFEEFLLAFNEDGLIDFIRDSFLNNRTMGVLHNKALDLYKKYLITGGMPESVKNLLNCKGDLINYDTSILSSIISDYKDDMHKHVSNSSETIKIISIYDSLSSQLFNSSKKFQFSKVQKGARARGYMTPLMWLSYSNMIQISNLVKLPCKPLRGYVDEENFKVFYSDVGILNRILDVSIKDIINDDLGLYKGVITENYVANQLSSLNIPLFFWKGSRDSEVDFLISTNDGIIPIEVKANNNTQSKSLNIYRDLYNPEYMIRLSTKDFGFNEESKIRSIPLYAVFLFKEL